MKYLLLISLVFAAICGCKKEAAPETDSHTEAPAGLNAVILDDAAQQRIGVKTETASAAELHPEIKSYGHVIDPAALAAAVGEFTTAQAANGASQAELNRLKTLTAQNNASERALQSAEAAAVRDAAAFDSARLKFIASWGRGIADRQDLPALVESLASLEKALVRIDLPPGLAMAERPSTARIATLDNSVFDASLVGEIPSVDAATQNRSFLFLIGSNSVNPPPGAAVTGFLIRPGAPLHGVIVPRSAVIRHEGAGWLYAQMNGTNFVRRLITLDEPTDNGWFVTNGVAAGENIVVTGAQAVFSDELSAGAFNAGERD